MYEWMWGRHASPHGYVPEIDALRALAAIAVVAFHAEVIRFGWMGVWLFFVISGFAITTSLLDLERSGAPLGQRLRTFYIRRTLRIWPLYFLVTILATVLAVVTATAYALDYLPWIATFTTNIRPFTLNVPTEHHWLPFSIMWSIAVEEQFYLLWPLLFVLTPKRFLGWVLLALAVSAILVRWQLGAMGSAWDWRDEKTAVVIYMFAPAHFDAFAAGCALAVFRRLIVERRWLAPASLIVAIILTLGYAIAFFATDTFAPSPSNQPKLSSLFKIFAFGSGREIFLYSVITIISTAILINIILRARWVSLICLLPGLQFIGKISFGLYLYHAFVMQIMFETAGTYFGAGDRPLFKSLLLFCICLAVSLAIAVLSFRFFESRLLYWKQPHASLPVR